MVHYLMVRHLMVRRLMVRNLMVHHLMVHHSMVHCVSIRHFQTLYSVNVNNTFFARLRSARLRSLRALGLGLHRRLFLHPLLPERNPLDILLQLEVFLMMCTI